MFVGDPVNTANGNLFDEFVDLDVGLTGLRVVRSYNGLGVSGGNLGERWRVSVGSALEPGAVGAVVVRPSDGARFNFVPDGAGGFVTPENAFAKLIVDGAAAVGTGPLAMLRLEHQDGRVERFDTNGRLIQVLGWDGTSASVTYSVAGVIGSVTSSSGPTLTFTTGSNGLVNGVVSSTGPAVTYGYSPANQLIEVIDDHGASTTMTYTTQGWLESVVAPGGVLKMLNTYDADGRVLTQTSASGGVTTFGYDVLAGVTSVHDSLTNTTVLFHHDTWGRVVRITDPFNNEVTRGYDATSNQTAGVDRSGVAVSATYDANSNILTFTEPGVGTTTYSYDTSNRVTSIAAPGQGTVTLGYDAAERIASTVTNALNETTTYDVVNGLVMSVTDADGVTVTYGYDTQRRLTSISNEYNQTTTYEYNTRGDRTKVISPSGRTTTWAYDPATFRMSSTTAPDGGVTSYTYDAAGRMLTVTDPTNAVTTNAYDTAGRLATTTHPGGSVTTFVYDSNDQLIRTIAPGGAESDTAYGPLGRVASTTDPLERATGFAYNADGDPTSITDPTNATVLTEYDTAGRPFKTIDAANRETVTSYDPAGRVSTVTAPGNRVTTYVYDALGRVTTTTDARGGQTSTTYTPGGRTDTVTDPVGLVTDYNYDLAGRTASVTAPGNRTTAYTYNTDSEVATITSPGGLVTTYAYDLTGRVAQITDPAGVATTRTWSTRGELLTEKVGAEGTVAFAYNPDGTTASATDALGNVTTFGYDARGNMTSRTNALGGVDSWSYNAADELVSSTDPLNRVTTYTYDAAGRLASTTDPTGRQITTTYNPDGSPATRSELNGPTTTYTYDTAGRLATATEPNSVNLYGYTYEPGGQLATMTTPLSRVTRWSYDAAGRRTKLTNPDGTSYLYTYDTAGRLATIRPGEIMADRFTTSGGTPLDTTKWTVANTAGATAVVNSKTARLRWSNTAGSTTAITATPAAAQDHDATYRYRFASTSATTAGTLVTSVRNSANGNVRIEQTSNSATARIFKQVGTTSTELGTFTVPISTDEQQLRVQLQGTTIKVKVWDAAVSEPSTWTVTLTTATGVTTAGQVKLTASRTSGTNDVFIDNYTQTNPTTPPAAIATYTYNADDQVTNEALVGGTRTRTYTSGRLTNYTTNIPGLSQTTALTYDTTGRIKTDNTGGVITTYTYDLASQLTAATPSTGTASTWTYDNLGRRTTQTVGATTTRNIYDSASQLCWSTTAALPTSPTCATPPSGAITYTYDQAGRLLTDTTTPTNRITYTYDTAGRLATSQRVNGTVTTNQTRAYNPFNNLEKLTSGNTTVELDWDPTTDVAGLIGTFSAGTTETLAAGPGGWVAARTGGANNAIGQRYDQTVIPATGTTTLARSSTYNAFGAPAGPDQPLPRLGYRGEVHIDNLLHLRNRDLQPTTARFTTVDPIIGRAGTPTIANPYHYADNDPLHRIDPLGLYSIRESTFAVQVGPRPVVDPWMVQYADEVRRAGSQLTLDDLDFPVSPKEYLREVAAQASGWLRPGAGTCVGAQVGGGVAVQSDLCLVALTNELALIGSAAIGFSAGGGGSVTGGVLITNAQRADQLGGDAVCIGVNVAAGPAGSVVTCAGVRKDGTPDGIFTLTTSAGAGLGGSGDAYMSTSKVRWSDNGGLYKLIQVTIGRFTLGKAPPTWCQGGVFNRDQARTMGLDREHVC
jgi:RHS repeat-associated protein